jgi:hypothetical protein
MAQNCLSKGQYCAFGSVQNEKITGRSILMESLRQSCIYKMNLNIYFFYTQMFNDKCIDTFAESCSKDIIEKTFMNWSDIAKCVDYSFVGNEKDIYQNDNNLLSNARQKSDALKVEAMPNLFFNDVQYAGSIAFSDLSMAMCDQLNQEVEECREVPLLDLEELNVAGLVIGMVLCFFLGLLIIGLICKKIAKRNYLR